MHGNINVKFTIETLRVSRDNLVSTGISLLDTWRELTTEEDLGLEGRTG
jgi:hypothetical protein